MGLCILLFISKTYLSFSGTLLLRQVNAMVGSFLLSFPQEGILCFVAERFIVTDAEMGAQPALLGAGKGKSKALS